MPEANFDRDEVLVTLNKILELELAGVVRYMHYSFMIFGHSRIPVVKWMRDQAQEAMDHATAAGEHITTLEGHPSLKIGKLLETERHAIDEILEESLEHEEEGLALYRQLLGQTEARHVALEEYSRSMIAEEEQHLAEIRKMLWRPGSRP